MHAGQSFFSRAVCPSTISWPARAQGRRVFLGRAQDKSAIVQLSDADSIPRLGLTVDSAGAASIEFLDDSGHVTRRISGKESGNS